MKILSVDDSKSIRTILKRIFEPYECDVLEASNGIKGLKITKEEHPDLIFLDVTMPGMNGREFLKTMRQDEEIGGIPVVMLTAEGDRKSCMEYINLGANGYIIKPFKAEELIAFVSRRVRLKYK